MRRCAAILLLVGMAGGLAGCTSRQFTTTPRTAIEQLLLSAAVDRAMARIELPEVSGKTVYLDFSNLSSYDSEYVKVATRARFSELGAVLAESADGADYVAEVASGGLGMEYKTGMIGLPALPVPSSPVPSPELALYRKVEQTGIMKLLVFVHSGGRFVSLHQYYARADRDEGFLLFWRFQGTDDIRQGWERADLELGRPAAGGD